MLTILVEPHTQYRAPEPGFAALRKRPGKLVRSYPSGVILSLSLDRELTLQEITVANRKLDRIHEFHVGQSVGFLLKARVILRECDEFNPGHAVKQLRDLISEIKTDVEKYAKINRVEQFELDDQALYDAEVRRANEVLNRD